MANFDKYAPALNTWEGGFALVKDDKGGWTNRGVTLDTFRLYVNPNATVEDLGRMTDAQWRLVAKGKFWDKCGGDKIQNQSIAELFVDWCFHSGIGMIKRVQGIVGVKADGIVGPQTIAAINRQNAKRLHFMIKAARVEFLANAVRNTSSNLKFYDGWINRVAALEFNKPMEFNR